MKCMKFAPNKAYHEGKTETFVIFDVRIPGAADRLHSERAAWGEYGDIEVLDKNHFALIVRPGGAQRLGA